MQRREKAPYSKVNEIDDSPGSAGLTLESGDDGEPREQDNQNICRPNAGILKPRGVLVGIRRRHHLHIKPSRYSLNELLRASTPAMQQPL